MVNSGTDIDEIVIFLARSSRLTADITFNITDDNVGLEDMQTYLLSIAEASSSAVTVAPYESTVVAILDDEGI